MDLNVSKSKEEIEEILKKKEEASLKVLEEQQEEVLKALREGKEGPIHTYLHQMRVELKSRLGKDRQMALSMVNYRDQIGNQTSDLLKDLKVKRKGDTQSVPEKDEGGTLQQSKGEAEPLEVILTKTMEHVREQYSKLADGPVKVTNLKWIQDYEDNNKKSLEKFREDSANILKAFENRDLLTLKNILKSRETIIQGYYEKFKQEMLTKLDTEIKVLPRAV